MFSITQDKKSRKSWQMSSWKWVHAWHFWFKIISIKIVADYLSLIGSALLGIKQSNAGPDPPKTLDQAFFELMSSRLSFKSCSPESYISAGVWVTYITVSCLVLNNIQCSWHIQLNETNEQRDIVKCIVALTLHFMPQPRWLVYYKHLTKCSQMV